MGLAAFGSAILVAIVGVIFRSEFEAWMPWLAERVRRIAIRSLRGQEKSRLDEEWSAYLQEVPGNIGKIFSAFGFYVAAQRINSRRARSRLSYFCFIGCFSLYYRYLSLLGALASNQPISIFFLRTHLSELCMASLIRGGLALTRFGLRYVTEGCDDYERKRKVADLALEHANAMIAFLDGSIQEDDQSKSPWA